MMNDAHDSTRLLLRGHASLKQNVMYCLLHIGR